MKDLVDLTDKIGILLADSKDSNAQAKAHTKIRELITAVPVDDQKTLLELVPILVRALPKTHGILKELLGKIRQKELKDFLEQEEQNNSAVWQRRLHLLRPLSHTNDLEIFSYIINTTTEKQRVDFFSIPENSHLLFYAATDLPNIVIPETKKQDDSLRVKMLQCLVEPLFNSKEVEQKTTHKLLAHLVTSMDVPVPGREKETVLMLTALRHAPNVIEYICRLILRLGVDLNAHLRLVNQTAGRTPLHISARAHLHENILVLMEKGADPDQLSEVVQNSGLAGYDPTYVKREKAIDMLAYDSRFNDRDYQFCLVYLTRHDKARKEYYDQFNQIVDKELKSPSPQLSLSIKAKFLGLIFERQYVEEKTADAVHKNHQGLLNNILDLSKFCQEQKAEMVLLPFLKLYRETSKSEYLTSLLLFSKTEELATLLAIIKLGELYHGVSHIIVTRKEYAPCKQEFFEILNDKFSKNLPVLLHFIKMLSPELRKEVLDTHIATLLQDQPLSQDIVLTLLDNSYRPGTPQLEIFLNDLYKDEKGQYVEVRKILSEESKQLSPEVISRINGKMAILISIASKDLSQVYGNILIYLKDLIEYCQANKAEAILLRLIPFYFNAFLKNTPLNSKLLSFRFSNPPSLLQIINLENTCYLSGLLNQKILGEKDKFTSLKTQFLKGLEDNKQDGLILVHFIKRQKFEPENALLFKYKDALLQSKESCVHLAHREFYLTMAEEKSLLRPMLKKSLEEILDCKAMFECKEKSNIVFLLLRDLCKIVVEDYSEPIKQAQKVAEAKKSLVGNFSSYWNAYSSKIAYAEKLLVFLIACDNYKELIDILAQAKNDSSCPKAELYEPLRLLFYSRAALLDVVENELSEQEASAPRAAAV